VRAGRARNFRELGDQAADLPQGVLARLGGKPHPLRRKIIAPSETRLRTLIQDLDADALDELIGGWLRALAQAGRLEGLLTAIAIDGKWLRFGVPSGGSGIVSDFGSEAGATMLGQRRSGTGRRCLALDGGPSARTRDRPYAN
jgi:hypothetical protein